MNKPFYKCPSFEHIRFPKDFKTENIVDMNGIFYESSNDLKIIIRERFKI